MHNEQKVTDSIYWIGANDFVTPRFDNLVPLPQGISYNTYFIDDEKTCVLDGIDNACRDIFMDNLSYLLKGRALDYIIINHMEPDHSGSLLALAEAHPKAKIIASPQAIKMFGQFFHVSFKDRTILSDEKMVLDLGVHKLRFIKAPMVHWPEVIMSYDLTDHVLFSADAFGQFGTVGNVYADQVDFEENYLDSARRYYVNIVGKYGPQVVNVLKKASGLPIDFICPLHGFVFRTPATIKYIIDKYLHWAKYVPEKKGVVIAFSSIYGNTERAACVLAHKLSQRGIQDIRLYDVAKIHSSYITAKAWEYSHLVLAAPTYNLNLFLPMENFLHDLKTLMFQKRTIGVIACHSWASAAYKTMVDYVENQFKCCELLEPTMDMKSSLRDDQECELDELADKLVESIKEYPDPKTLI